MTYLEARNRAITEAMTANDRVVMIGDFSGAGAPEGGYARAFGKQRVRATPISEEGFAGVAVGASLYGLRPIVTFTNPSFMFDAWEPVLNDAALLRYMSGGQFSAPVIFHISVRLRPGWAAQHQQTAASMLCNAPGVVVVAPGTPEGAYELMKTAIASSDPVVYIDSGALYNVTADVPI